MQNQIANIYPSLPSPTSSDGSFDVCLSPAPSLKISKLEIRRQKNKESSRRSRARKQALLATLPKLEAQVAQLKAQLEAAQKDREGLMLSALTAQTEQEVLKALLEQALEDNGKSNCCCGRC